MISAPWARNSMGWPTNHRPDGKLGAHVPKVDVVLVHAVVSG